MPARDSLTNNERPQRVFLIDSMSHIFRAFFAPMQNRAAPLATSQGFVTQAVYIFTNMLLKLLREEQPDYIAAIFESREKTFRHETFADYKANRLAMPEDLAKQMPYIFRLCGLEYSGHQLSRLRSRRRDWNTRAPGCGKTDAGRHRLERQRHVPARSRSLCRLHAEELASSQTQRTGAADRMVRRSVGRK